MHLLISICSLAREETGDWLVLHVQELVSVAYQICTIQLESMQPIGVEILSSILDKFEIIEDPELPGHLLLEQYQAQLVSACRTALDVSSGPILLEAGLCLATKILTSGIISEDQASMKRIYSLISHPLDDFKDLYYPSFSEWVSCKIKIRLLFAHASLKCYSYTFLKKQHGMSNGYSSLLPMFSKSSSVLGKYWTLFLRDYIYICLGMQHNKSWQPFLDGIQSPLASAKLMLCLKEAWPVIFQAVALDANPSKNSLAGSSSPKSESYHDTTLSGYNMVDLVHGEFQLMWSYALLNLFQWQHPDLLEQMVPAPVLVKLQKEPLGDKIDVPAIKVHEIVLPVLQFLSSENFFRTGFHNIILCQELVKILAYFIDMDDSWHSLAIPVFFQIVQNCPEEFLATQSFVNSVLELWVAYLYKAIKEANTMQVLKNRNDLMSTLFSAARALSIRLKAEAQSRSLLIFLIAGYECCRGAATESNFSAAREFICHVNCLFKNKIAEGVEVEEDVMHQAKSILGGCITMAKKSSTECIESIYTALARMPKIPKLLQMKLALYLELAISYAELTYQMVLGRVCEGSDVFILSCLKHSLSFFETTLTDSNIQVRAIGLHVLYSVAQKGYFYLYFMSELSGAIFSTLLTMLKKPVAREKMAIVGECVRMLVLMHSLSKDSECERGIIDMLLEGILMVLSASEDDFSPEIVDVRNLSVKIVSQLAQLPSSAVIFKEALLALPALRRQQLQVIIRASVINNQSTAQLASSNTPLIIKLPAQSVESKVTTYPSYNSDKNEEVGNEVEDNVNDDDDDDWDAFQSIPATAPPNADSFEESVAQNTTANSDDDFQSSASTPPNEDLEVESTGEPPLIIDSNNDNSNALESPSNACHSESEANFDEEDPIPEDHAKADIDEVLSSFATDDAIHNVDFDTDEPTPLDDSKIHSNKALDQPSAMSSAPEFESEAGLDKQEPSSVDVDSNKAPHSSSSAAAVMSEVESEAGLDIEKPSSLDVVSNEALQSLHPSAVTSKFDSEAGFNNTAPAEEPTSVNEALQPNPIVVNPEVESGAELNREKTKDILANDVAREHDESTTPESPVFSSVVPELQDCGKSCSKTSDSV